MSVSPEILYAVGAVILFGALLLEIVRNITSEFAEEPPASRSRATSARQRYQR